MEAKVKAILEAHYPGARVMVEPEPGLEKIGGYVIWDGFEDREPIDRQREIYHLLRRELGPEAQRVSLIFTYTPNEFELMSAA